MSALEDTDEPEDCWTCRGTGMGRTDASRCYDCCGTGIAGQRERAKQFAEDAAEYRAQYAAEEAMCGHRYYDGT
jgi:DnaJ-class molecular chaperone